MNADQLIQEVTKKYSEWLDHAGGEAPSIMIGILAKMLIIEKEEKEYYKQRLKHERSNAVNG